MTTTHFTTALPIIARIMLPLNDRACDSLCDRIATALNDDTLTPRATRFIAFLVEGDRDDHCAHILDTIRDNNFHDLDI